jgi:biopolymer transport protein ExbD
MAVRLTDWGVTAEPNVAPMISVTLVLLITCMTVLPGVNEHLARIPTGQNLPSHPVDPSDQVLEIDVRGQYYLNKSPIKNTDLPALFKEIYAGRAEDKVIYLMADKELDYGKILTGIDIASRNGVRVAGLITEQASGTRSTVAGDNPMTDKPAKGGT